MILGEPTPEGALSSTVSRSNVRSIIDDRGCSVPFSPSLLFNAILAKPSRLKAPHEIHRQQPATGLPSEASIPAAGFFSFLFSVYLYFVLGEENAGIFVGLWVPSIHSLGTLIVAPAKVPVAVAEREKVDS